MRCLFAIDKGASIGFNLNTVKMKSAKKEKKKAYHHGDLRRVLVEEAAKLASREGVESVSLRRVATAARVSPAAPYHHFKNKSDLLAAVADEGFRRLHGTMARTASGYGKGKENVEGRLQGLGLAYVRFAVRHPHFFRVMFRPEIARAAEPDPESWGQRAYFQLIRSIQEVMGEEGEPSDEVMREVLYAWCIVHGLSSLWVDGALSLEEPYASWGVEALAEYVTGRAGVGKGGGKK